MPLDTNRTEGEAGHLSDHGALAGLYNQLEGGVVVAVNHGADNTVARPNAAVVIWVGTVQPLNWTDADIWNDTTAV